MGERQGYGVILISVDGWSSTPMPVLSDTGSPKMPVVRAMSFLDMLSEGGNTVGSGGQRMRRARLRCGCGVIEDGGAGRTARSGFRFSILANSPFLCGTTVALHHHSGRESVCVCVLCTG